MTDDSRIDLSTVDDQCRNDSGNPPLAALVDQRRRTLLKGGLALAAFSILGGGFLGGGMVGCSTRAGRGVGAEGLLGFRGVAMQQDPHFDRVVVADGYRAQPFFSWGDAVVDGARAWDPQAGDDWQMQLLQAGQNHDGMHFFPFPDDPAGHGLLAINHENIESTLHPVGFGSLDGSRPLAQVRKEQAAHGVSIIEVRRIDGSWQRVLPSRFNRRLSALTPMAIGGPLAGHAAMRTAADPAGRTVLGTLNNCAMGWTPWGTYLTCEENWHNYFVNRDAADYAARPSHRRYGVGKGKRSAYFNWESVDPRFDATPQPGQPHGGFVNEPHRFGWVVEIDPFDPASTPVKRTALGRFCREGATVVLAPDGRVVCYSGDDSRGEYLYKFVSAGRFDAARPDRNRTLLDEGTLFVARFDADGGEWLPLVHGSAGLTAADGFADQASVLINARLAGDRVGATPLDRPEWVAAHPHSGECYLSLTNNADRGRSDPVDAANPRPRNLHGHIVRWREQGGDAAATRFDWDIFLLAGEPQGAAEPNRVGDIRGDIFSSPDSLAFDGAGRLWIATDYDDGASAMAAMGCNQLLCADPASREVRRFLVGPRGCEITGITWNDDYTAMWVNVQHPGLSYPASDGDSRPRCTTVLVTREDGGVIGT